MLKRTGAAIIVFAGMAIYAWSPDLDWRTAEEIPFVLRDGVELARHSAARTPASLSLICGVDGGLHLLLRTRLPIPAEFRRNMPGRVENVSVIIGDGMTQQLQVAVDIVATASGSGWWFERLVGGKPLDTMVTSRLPPEKVTMLESWFGSSRPPSRVAVMGILETGSFMVGTRTGEAIGTLRSNCVAA
ncbi:hypothetical protein [Bosea sp. ASV33]|uniref:hypothetical protein n=1 Tax=Bosea sp. ASV33 TaxID=2795106 RepID=UPI0018EE3975|nr:hypothetical protein [Bosea sp. ASV33]